MPPNTTMKRLYRSRLAGLLYLIIITSGITAEWVLRGPLMHYKNSAATIAAIRDNSAAFRGSIAADMLMAIASAGVAVVFYALFRPVSPRFSRAAMVFRLIQSAIISMNLLLLHAAWLIISGSESYLNPKQADNIAYFLLRMHGYGYSMAMLYLSIYSFMIGALIRRAPFAPSLIGDGQIASGFVFLIGTILHFFVPGIWQIYLPVYLIPVIADSAMTIWLLRGPRDRHNALRTNRLSG